MPSITSQSTGGQDDGSNSPTDSDHESKDLIVWTGYAKRVPVMLFRPHSMISGCTDQASKAVGGRSN
ncbi:hypothetical protein NP493_818g00010 [Ridgeia piscesae]|uniref:Uncharacterized protein n=1 Tax=Ridgeia piscesae TaxID=27915 RepID=A0AAD9NMT6_RIDPI|nr:hypothetical protein NP493_818g00010 [Ridgeia piscesae]